jgi:hypothetical protein
MYEKLPIAQFSNGGVLYMKEKKKVEHDEVLTDKDVIVEKGMPPQILARHENDSNPEAYDLRDPEQLNAD